MSGNITDVIKKGQVKVKGKRLGLWKSQWLQLRSASSRGPWRLERCAGKQEPQQSDDDVEKSLPLNNILSIKRLTADQRKKAIEITFNSPQTPPFTFCAENNAEVESWYSELEQVRSSPDHENSMFRVNLLPTPNLRARGECLLQVSSKVINLYHPSNPDHPLTHWPLSSLRRYGRDGAKFTIESGRSSPSGEGIFVFNSYQYDQIYNAVHRASLMIQESLRVINTSQMSGNPPIVPRRPLTASMSFDSSLPISPTTKAAATRRASVDNAATVPLPSVSEATEREGDSADRGPVPSEPVAIRRQDSTDSADRGPLPSEPEATQKQGSVGSVPCEPVANGRGALPSEPEADRQRNSPPPSEPVATQRQSSVDSANRGPLPPVPGT